jgi:predicted cupin superfamily sugar epimerase
MDDARRIIERLGLRPHPEGGWYRETWRPASPAGGRGAGSAIHFLLEQGQRSHWHKVDAAELWLFHAGAPLELRSAKQDAGPVTTTRLGPDVLAGHSPQHLIEAGEWQAAHADVGWALVSCVVVPGFRFEGFELAPAGWEPG